MRTREEIEKVLGKEFKTDAEWTREYINIELLLDIRDILTHPPHEVLDARLGYINRPNY